MKEEEEVEVEEVAVVEQGQDHEVPMLLPKVMPLLPD